MPLTVFATEISLVAATSLAMNAGLAPCILASTFAPN